MGGPDPRGPEFKFCRCCRCDHEWIRRVPGSPKRCPHCHSPYWAQPRGQKRGRHRKWKSILRSVKSMMRLTLERFEEKNWLDSVIVWITGLDGNCIYMSQRWYRLTGMKRSETSGFTRYIHPEDVPRIQAIYYRAFEAREPFAYEYRLRYADGRYRWIFGHGQPEYSVNSFLREGDFLGYLGFALEMLGEAENTKGGGQQ